MGQEIKVFGKSEGGFILRRVTISHDSRSVCRGCGMLRPLGGAIGGYPSGTSLCGPCAYTYEQLNWPRMGARADGEPIFDYAPLDRGRSGRW